MISICPAGTPLLFIFHYSSFIIHQNKKAVLEHHSRTTKLTWYHLVSRQRTGHTAPFPAGRKFRQWPGISSSPQRPSAFAGPPLGRRIQTTQNALTGEPVDAYLSTPQLRDHVRQIPTCPITPTGALWKASPAYSSLHSFFPNIPAHYTDKRPHLSTFKLQFVSLTLEMLNSKC